MSAKIRLDLQRQLFARSERVKGIDFHPTEPWVCTLRLEKEVYNCMADNMDDW